MKEQDNHGTTSQFLKTDGGKTKSNAIEVPSIALPKGGGAIKGIDEKFSVNAVNGTASFSIPLPFAPARGASPALSLSYNSGSGNGIFGLGWNISLPSIKRKTDKGLPQYFDNIDSDIFLFSEAEDLVPEFQKEANGRFSIDPVSGEYIIFEKDYPITAPHTHKIRFYKPRTEGLFARIERWTQISGQEAGTIKWRIITKDNTTTLFGWSGNSRIADPADPNRVYEWLPEFVFDDKGNCSQYIYEGENISGLDADSLHDKNRIKNRELTYTNRYLKKILYGNTEPYLEFNTAFPAADKYLFETVFDYGLPAETPDIINAPNRRTDSFSDYKAGFEIRITRLCKRVLLFHHFTGANEYDGLVKSLNFEYDTDTQKDFTFLKSITAFGYIKKSNGTYSKKNLPPTEFTYQQHEWNKDVKTISTENLVHAPSGLDEGQYQFTDLFNEGLSGILTEQAGGWYYKHNLGNGEFENAKLVSPKPSFAGLGSQLQLADLDANGGKQLVNYSAEPKGYFELSDEEEWQPFKNFRTLPNINLNDANTRMLDLNGDGKAEVLISEDNVFTWYESAGKHGFTNSFRTAKPYDEETGPAIVFADSEQRIFLADMSGDGLSDIVRIRNGEVCYWPNMGYGKFGAKVLMDNAPVFDLPGSFNPSYLRLADIDGSGTTDIIYLGKNKFSCWSNLSGNAFNTLPSFEIDAFPDIHNQAKITVTDLLGNGVACIVWSSPLAKDANAPLRYIDLMKSKKPHIMVKYVNNMGKEVSMEYLPSTHFYLEDKKAGRPWITKLHFPVHCIAKTTTEDKISGYVFVSTYKYHHGYYDHAEREFRGFGMVEQTDTEDFEKWKKVVATNKLEDEKLNQAPVFSKSWVHTGAFLGEEKILNQFEKEYWFEELKRFEANRHTGVIVTNNERELPGAKIIDESGRDLIAGNELSAQDWQEALRACKGMALRSEVFAKDAPKENPSVIELRNELTPYSVATHNCIIQRLQPRGNNKHAIFIVKESEAITYSYERTTDDPRVAHNLNIKFDNIGNVLEAASVVYPRNPAKNTFLPEPTRIAQGLTYITFTQTAFTNDIDVAFKINKLDAYRLRLPAEVKTWQLQIHKNFGEYFTLSDFHNIINNAETAEYYDLEKKPEIISQPNDEPVVYSKVKRLIEHIRTTYRNDNLIGQLAVGEMHSHGIVYESYQLAYTPELLNNIYNGKLTGIDLEKLRTDGNFVHSEADLNWWIQSGQMNFIDTGETVADAQARFYLPISYTDPYGSVTKVEYETHKLFIKKTIDALLNESTVTKFNYRTLSPQQMMDMNENLSEAITDELGLVKAMAIMGKDFNKDGIGDEADDLSLLREETTDQTAINEFFVIANADGICNSDNLHSKAKGLLQHATARFVYDFDEYLKNKKPAVVTSIARETHYRDKNKNPIDETKLKLQLSFEYSNGIGKVIMKKVQAEPGDAKEVIVNADKSVTIILRRTDQTAPKELRWIGNGRTILNNKGNPVKQYEPFFSVSPKFEAEKELVETGVTPIMYYDAMSRLIKTETPDGTFSKVEFDSWQQRVFDANDTVSESDWYDKRKNLPIINPERIAADKATAHFNTPSQLHFDTLGRPVLQIENNSTNPDRDNKLYKTKIELDIEGNLRSVTDAREIIENQNLGNVVMEYKYDMLGNMVYQKSMDAGERWLMTNILGQPLRTWDARGHKYEFEYNDPLHRMTDKIVTGIEGAANIPFTIEKIIYGESLSDAKARNLRGQAYLHYDSAGLTKTEQLDFKGNLLEVRKKLTNQYQAAAIDWSVSPDTKLETEEFVKTTEYDALNRMVSMQNWNSPLTLAGVYSPQYNERGLLIAERFETGTNSNEAVLSITYNEKGQRLTQQLGCGTTTQYIYNPENFRLVSLITSPPGGGNNILQHLLYTYDPVGNIMQIEDTAYQPVFFNNQQIDPKNKYTYDALYRLTQASGRENNTFDTAPAQHDNYWREINFPVTDAAALRNYTQNYIYDEVGNIKEMRHIAGNGAQTLRWTRNYEYEANCNQLKYTYTGNDLTTKITYEYDAHGSIKNLGPTLDEFVWNYNDMVQSASLGGGGTAYYNYSSDKQRTRKRIEKGGITEDRIYLEGFERYRRWETANNPVEVIATHHLFSGSERLLIAENVITTNDNNLTTGLLCRYQYSNHLGSACLELDKDAKVISYEEYHPYGTTAYQAKNASIKCASKRYRYTGMERDEETGLEYHSARYYLPWLGRWLSADPIGIGGGINIYVYSRLNPVCNLDTNGKFAGPQPVQVQPLQGAPSYQMQPTMTGSYTSNQTSGILIPMSIYENNNDGTEMSSAMFPNLNVNERNPNSPWQRWYQESSYERYLKEQNYLDYYRGYIRRLLDQGQISPGQYEILRYNASRGYIIDPNAFTVLNEEQDPDTKQELTERLVIGFNSNPKSIPPQFRIGNYGETMAHFSIKHSAVAGPSHLMDKKSTLKNSSTGKTVYASKTKRDSRFPDGPIAAENGAVGTVEIKTTTFGLPIDPYEYLKSHPDAAAQLTKEQEIISKGGKSWGPKDNLVEVVPGEGIGITTGMWIWYPPRLLQ